MKIRTSFVSNIAKKIPFIATIHYEHFLLFFDGEKIKVIPTNLEAFMYFGNDNTDSLSFSCFNKKLKQQARSAKEREEDYKEMLDEVNKNAKI